MNNYQSSRRRAVSTVAALAMTAITMGMLVAPAGSDRAGSGAVIVAASSNTQAVATEVDINPGRIDVIATRGRSVNVADSLDGAEIAKARVGTVLR